MPWHRDEPDPLENRRRQLAEQERLLSEQRRRLKEELQLSGDSSPEAVKRAEPLVWRAEEDGLTRRAVEPTPARKRNLARQTQRDMILFIVFSVVLLVLVIVLWITYVHNTATGSRA